MIRPRARLLWCVGVLGASGGLAAAVYPAVYVPVLFALLVFALMVLLDALAAFQREDAIQVALKDGGRQSKDHTGDITLKLSGTVQRATSCLVALPMPPVFDVGEEFLRIRTVPGEWEGELTWTITPRKRGRYFLGPLYVTTGSPFGFWERRRAVPANIEVRVYPNLLQERRRLAGIFMNRGIAGVHAQRRVGRGRDFEQLREYIPGDSYEDVHWKATARRLRPVTKMYQVERTQEIYVMVDTSRLSARAVRTEGGRREPQLDRFIAAALVLALVTQKQGDLFGLVTFSDRVHGFVRARTGREHFNLCRDALYMAEPRVVNPDFEELFTFLRLRLRKRALLVVLTNLDDPTLAEAFTRNARLLAQRHLLLVHMITPRGAAPIFHGRDPRGLEDIYRQLTGHMQWHALRELQRELHQLGVNMLLTDSEALAPELVSQYVNIKQRQAL